MYSQYQASNYGNVNNQVTQSNPSQQQQQMIWNGSQWTTTTAAAASTPHSQQTSQQLVAQYTNYYHQWTALVSQYTGSESQWAKYHADQASRAAHYFHNHPGITQAPPELELPPVPPNNNNNFHSNVQSQQPYLQQQSQPYSQQSPYSQQQQQQYPQQPQPSQQPSTKSNASDGMKRYLDRSIQRYGTAYKPLIVKQFEGLIMKLVQSGSLATTNWEMQPLIELEGVALTTTNSTTAVSSATTTASATTNMASHNSAQSGYYGPLTTAANDSPTTTNKLSHPHKKNSKHVASSKKKRPIESSDSYYGPSTNTTCNTHLSDFIPVPGTNHKSLKRKKKAKTTGFDDSHATLSSRADRFGDVHGNKTSKKGAENWDKYMGLTSIGGSKKQLDESDYEKMTVRGTCETLGKSYLRLTAPPKAELVRPQPILEQHLTNLKKLRMTHEKDYLWFCSQLKAIRQDCTVQRIQNAFAVDVYETHARIALEEGDMNEFNQSQTQLKELYVLLEHQKDSADAQKALQHRNEFVGYRIIYQVFLVVENEGGSADLFQVMLSLTETQKQDLHVRHALKVREACTTDLLDYHLLFGLRRRCPTAHAAHLMDKIVPTVRFRSLQRLCAGYRPTSLPVEFVLRELGLEEKEKEGLEWLKNCGCVLSENDKTLRTKETIVRESVSGQTSLI